MARFTKKKEKIKSFAEFSTEKITKFEKISNDNNIIQNRYLLTK